MADDKLTPMMRQYRGIRARLPEDTILFFRLGDFYEMFFDDAVEASRILDIALTKRNKVPMCGIPYHASDAYLAKLVKAGKKVAVCDQVEAPTAGKIVRREVTGVITPGAALSESILDSDKHNYLASLYKSGGKYGLAFVELSTGAFVVEEISCPGLLRESLLGNAVVECVVPDDMDADAMSPTGSVFAGLRGITLSPYASWAFEYESAYDTLIRHFGVKSLDGFGIEGFRAVVGAAGGALHYLKNELRRNVGHIHGLRLKNPADYLIMDEATRTNLDVVDPPGRSRGYGTVSTLFDVLNGAMTSMGSRMLREWIVRPSAAISEIRARHDAVAFLASDQGLLRKIRGILGGIRDMERIVARLGAGGGNARDLKALEQSLKALPDVPATLGDLPSFLISDLKNRIVLLPDLVSLIDSAIIDEPPVSIKDGGIIRRGYNADLDELRDAAAGARNWLAEYQIKEQERTGIKTLKVRHNKVFGYYIEVSKGQLANVPDEYVRKQTLVNAERFITPQLKEYENRIFGAQERSIALELEIFENVRDKAVAHTPEIQASSLALAQLDVLAAFADKALLFNYVRPVMNESSLISVKAGRHPVVERTPDAERFVPNDVLLDSSGNRLLVITGPNMAGKSTYIRQAALIAVMAHAGSFVPAESAEISVVDRIFTRVGAGDDLAGGRSTFMVEMQETANILNNATDRSLIVLDEIGRGTSTFDGISIAWAVAEHLHENIKAKTLFATHYHELTDLALTMPGVQNYNMLVKEQGDKISFLRRIVPGGADKSYGIQVARLAGLPDSVILRSKEILANLEEGEFEVSGKPKLAGKRGRKVKVDDTQLTLFGTV